MNHNFSIKQFRYSGDNLGYLLWCKYAAMAIDGGAVEDILSFTKANGLQLLFVANTHGHGDHTCGNQGLLSRSKAKRLNLSQDYNISHIDLGGRLVNVYRTPGHTMDSICFHAGDFLITGDTLFNGTVGNCFSGDMLSFFHSIEFLCTLPPQTKIYAGHDYVAESMRIARFFEPDNNDIDTYLANYNPQQVCSSLADEFKVNPYLRFNQPSIRALLQNKRLPGSTPYERWHSVMSLA